VLGPIIGGSLAESKATWRWAFYINLVLVALFVPAYLFMIPSIDPRPGVPQRVRLAGIDKVGAVLVFGGFVAGIMAISFGGVLYDWNTATIIVLLCLSGVLFILFGIQQVWSIFTTPEQRLFPVQFFKSRTLLVLFIQSAALGAPIFIPVYFIPLFFQFTKGDTALEAGVRLLPFICLLVFFCILNGGVMGKEGHYAPWFIVAMVFIVTGSALMFTVDEKTGTSRVYAYSAILGIGSGIVVQTSFIVAQAVVPRSDMSLAVAFINIAQIGGLAISLCLANSVFLNVAKNKIHHILPNVNIELIKSAISGTNSVYLKSLSPELQQRVLHAIVESISDTYILCIAAGALGFVLSLTMKWERVFLTMD